MQETTHNLRTPTHWYSTSNKVSVVVYTSQSRQLEAKKMSHPENVTYQPITEPLK